MEKWKVLDSSYILQRPWATIRVDKLKMPNGQVKEEYYVLEYPNWVNMVGITRENKLVMVRQYRHGAAEILLELPAGVIEPGELPEEAAKRELLEETGYSFDSIEYICELYPNPATSANITYTYLLKGGHKTQEQALDPSEDIDVEVLEIDQVKQMLFDNKIGQSLHSSALFYTFKKLGVL